MTCHCPEGTGKQSADTQNSISQILLIDLPWTCSCSRTEYLTNSRDHKKGGLPTYFLCRVFNIIDHTVHTIFESQEIKQRM
jgi:hypothetical protein